VLTQKPFSSSPLIPPPAPVQLYPSPLSLTIILATLITNHAPFRDTPTSQPVSSPTYHCLRQPLLQLSLLHLLAFHHLRGLVGRRLDLLQSGCELRSLPTSTRTGEHTHTHTSQPASTSHLPCPTIPHLVIQVSLGLLQGISFCLEGSDFLL